MALNILYVLYLKHISDGFRSFFVFFKFVSFGTCKININMISCEHTKYDQYNTNELYALFKKEIFPENLL